MPRSSPLGFRLALLSLATATWRLRRLWTSRLLLPLAFRVPTGRRTAVVALVVVFVSRCRSRDVRTFIGILTLRPYWPPFRCLSRSRLGPLSPDLRILQGPDLYSSQHVFVPETIRSRGAGCPPASSFVLPCVPSAHPPRVTLALLCRSRLIVSSLRLRVAASRNRG